MGTLDAPRPAASAQFSGTDPCSPLADVHEMHQVASRHYAFEGRCFVLAAGQIMSGTALPSALLPGNTLDPQSLIERGGSAIIAPEGQYLVGPIFDEEAILYAAPDLQEIEKESMTMDVSGHYSRPDIFQLKVAASDRRTRFDGT